MKQRNFFRRLLILMVILFAVTTASAQVTIGSTDSPIGGALLQLKENGQVDGVNATRGFALPRVALSDPNRLFPMFLQDPADPESGATQYYEDNKEELHKVHTGLTVYNIVEDLEKGLCLGLNLWNGEEWSCFEMRMGNAVFDPVQCTDISVEGIYVESTPLTSANFLTVRLNVTRPGSYNIMATTDNGYNFFFTGVALSLGEIFINIPAQGTPVNAQIDSLNFSGLRLAEDCYPMVEIASAVAEYSINCARTVVQGQYVKGVSLTNENTVTVSVTVTKPGSFHIATVPASGIHFSASGEFTTGTHNVTLIGSGTPTVNSDIPVTIQTNTPAGSSTCNALVPITLPPMTFMVIGGSGVYSWAHSSRHDALTSAANFGPNGTVRIAGLTRQWQLSVADAVAHLTNTTIAQPDIILYNAYETVASTELSTALAEYVKRGGVLIFGARSNISGDLDGLTQVRDIMTGIFGTGTFAAEWQSGGFPHDNVYLINNLPDCPVINGPFGNLGGSYWGEDNDQIGSVIFTTMPPGSTQIATARSTMPNTTRDPEHSIVWYNNSYNILYFGDSNGSIVNNTNCGEFPTIFTAAGLPQGKLYGPATASVDGVWTDGRRWIVNAALELNAVAWAVRRAAERGINQH